MTCTTHHHACECREAAHAAEIARLQEIVRGVDDGGHWYSQQTMDARVAEIARLTAEVERLRADAQRLTWLALHPRGAKIAVDGYLKDCIFWGISSASNNTLREAIDAAMGET